MQPLLFIFLIFLERLLLRFPDRSEVVAAVEITFHIGWSAPDPHLQKF